MVFNTIKDALILFPLEHLHLETVLGHNQLYQATLVLH